MRQNRILIALLLVVAAASAAISAQDTTSPYSKFGYGILRDNATSAQRMMGGVGYAMRGGRQINVMNPASYANIDTLTFLFDTGVSLSRIDYNDNGNKLKTTGGGLDYITMQFPVGKRMGMSLGLVPYSSVGYSFGSKINNGVSLRTGEGGLNQLYLGVAGRIVDNLTAGANISYFFGTTKNETYATTTADDASLFVQETEVRDFHIDLGVQYSIDINPRNRLTAGLTFSPGKTLLGHTMVTTSEILSSSVQNVLDTVAYTSLKGHFSIPCTWGAGLNWEWNRRLTLEADFTYQPWARAKFAQIDNYIGTRFQNRWKMALGGQYIINPRGNYFQRINFRAGAYYSRDYIMVGTNSVKDYGVTCGLGLPAPSGKTVINLGFEYRNRRAYPNPLLKENVFNITLGVNFNETWFWQNKIR